MTEALVQEKINDVLSDWKKFKVNIPVIQRFGGNGNQSYKIYRVLKIYLSCAELVSGELM